MNAKIFAALLCLILAACCLSVGRAQENSLTDRDKEYLINLARQTLYWYLKDQTKPQPDTSLLTDGLRQRRGCFVTLYKRSYGLRGCVGVFGGARPLYENVIDRTIAATRDRRFPIVSYDELKDIKIEISVLTDPQALLFDSPEDLLAKLRPNQDGVILVTRYGDSTFIPQVWKQMPDKEEFMSELCAKHAAPRDTWKKDYKSIQVFTYQAIIVSEESYGRRVIGRNGAVVGKRGATVLEVIRPPSQGAQPGKHKVPEGTKLEPGTIVTPDSDITEP